MALSLNQVEKKRKKINQKSLSKSPASMEVDDTSKNIKPWSRESKNSPPPEDKQASLTLDTVPESLNPESSTSDRSGASDKNSDKKRENRNSPFPFKFRIPVPKLFHQKSS